MEIGKHLGKGLWGIADKALPVVYGVAYVVLVIRVLPEEEFGNFVLIQEIFLIISGLITAFALHPLLKFGAEEESSAHEIITAALSLNVAFVVLASIVLVAFRDVVGDLLNSRRLGPLLLYMPGLLAASFIRNFTLILLQSRFMIKEVFWTDAAHFLGTPFLIWIFSRLDLFHTAFDVVLINIYSLAASSLVGYWVSRNILSLRFHWNSGVFKKVWDYGRYSFGGIVSFLFYTRADSLILSSFGGPVQVAVYNSVKVFIRVYDMVTQVVQMFILPATSRLSFKGEHAMLKALVEKGMLFTTIGIMPVCLLFLFASEPLVEIIYGGRYSEAIPMLRVFSLLSFVIPIIAVASNTLMGLGHARLGFIISLQILVASCILYGVVIPAWGAFGATIGYVAASFVLAGLHVYHMRKFVPVTPREILRRTHDIRMFILSRLSRR